MKTKMLNIWMLNIGESLPIDGNNARLMRYGLLANVLNSLGHKVTWWSSTFDHFRKRFRSSSDSEITVNEHYHIKILHSVPYTRNVSINRWRNHNEIAKKFRLKVEKEQRPDIILASIPTIELAYESVVYANKYNVPVIIDLRDMWPDIFLNVFPKGTKTLARLLLSEPFNKMQAACINATAMMGISQEYLDWGLSYAKRDQRKSDIIFPLSCCPINIDDKEQKMVNAYQFWENYGLSIHNKDNLIISFIGNFGKRFELDTILKAAKKIGSKFKFVLGGLGEQHQACQKMAESLDNVILPGWLDNHQIAALLKLSTFGLAPYHSTPDFTISIPNKPIEYLSYGVPILSSLRGALETFLEKKECGFTYQNNNSDSLVDLLMKMANDSVTLKRLSLHSRKAYEENFLSETIYQNMANYLVLMAET